MSTELSGGVARDPSTENESRRPLRVRTGVMLALAVAIVGGVFAAVTEFVLHRWFHLYSSSIAGAAWLLFGGYWSLASVRRLRSSAPIAESGGDPPVWPGTHILAAYRASFPRVASIAFAVIALAGVVDRLLRT